MAEKIKMDFALMEEAIQAFTNGGQQLEDTINTVTRMAAILEDGALLGKAGGTFAEALRTQMAPAVGRLRDKFVEVAQDLRDNVDIFIGMDEDTSRFY